MMFCRALALIVPQKLISSIVRKQPVQNLLFGFISHTLMQGDSIFGGA
jgi:hypothetical protein